MFMCTGAMAFHGLFVRYWPISNLILGDITMGYRYFSPASSSMAAVTPKPIHISLLEKNLGLLLISSGSRMMG